MKRSALSVSLRPARLTTLSLVTASLVSLHANALAGDAFADCLAGLQADARDAGVRPDNYARYTQGLAPDMSVVEKLDFQPEFKTPIWDYLSGLVDDERVADGRRMMDQYAATLKKVETQYGVDAETVVAVWGVESNFGQSFGKYPLLQALGTLSCNGRRQTFFRKEFYSAMRILQGGHIAPERLVGSWAGAFGHTQFMPTTFERLAVDFDGDGRRDLMDNANDALASTANFLAKAGWRTGEPWGYEVRLPKGFDMDGESRRNKRPMSEWRQRGLRKADGSPLADFGKAGLLAPAGANGPAFLVFRNFDAIYSYNAAESYGLAIAHLSDRLRGAGPFATAWPTDDPGLSRAERRELQGLLILKGHDIGEVDGMLGSRSREAIEAEEVKLGWPATGRGGQRILKALRQ